MDVQEQVIAQNNIIDVTSAFYMQGATTVHIPIIGYKLAGKQFALALIANGAIPTTYRRYDNILGVALITNAFNWELVSDSGVALWTGSAGLTGNIYQYLYSSATSLLISGEPYNNGFGKFPMHCLADDVEVGLIMNVAPAITNVKVIILN